MPSYNITLQDFSPLIVYSGAWQSFGNTNEDEVPILANYSGKSFANTSSIGSSLSLSFWGTGIYVEGAKRPSYGSFDVTLDGQLSTINASRTQDIFQTALFAASGLTSSQHTITVNCTGEAFDIDFIKFTAGDGDESTSNVITTIDDKDALVTYFPSESEWQTTVSEQSDYFDRTAHQTNSSDASLKVAFSGNAIEVYGSVNSDHGLFSVQIDSENPLTLNASSTQYHMPSVPIFVAGGLESGSHTLVINNTGGETFDIDQVVNSTWPSFFASSGGSTAPSSPQSSSSSGESHSRVGVIVGPIIGVPGFMALCALAFFWFRKRRRVAASAKIDSFSLDLPETDYRESRMLSPYTATSSDPMQKVSTFPGVPSQGNGQRISYLPMKSTSGSSEAVTPTLPRAPSTASANSGSPMDGGRRDVVHETDAGPVPVSEYDASMRLLPPAYHQLMERSYGS